MILPSKHLHPERALLTVGGHILKLLTQPKTVSALWETFRSKEDSVIQKVPRITYNWFILSLNLLYTIGAIELDNGLIIRNLS